MRESNNKILKRFKLTAMGVYIAAAVVVFISVFPFIWMFFTSIKPPNEIFTLTPRLLPYHTTLENYVGVFKGTMFGRYFLNSVIIALSTTVLGLSIAILGAYSLARFKYPGRHSFLLLILIVQMFPIVVLIIPLFVVMRQLHLLNTHYCLIISYTTFILPLCVWMLKGFFESIPKELEEAAMIDGCSRVGAFLKIALPLSVPGIAATSIFSFIGAWNEFMFALTFINKEALKTIPVGLQSFIGRFVVEWGQVMAASVMFTLPSLIFFMMVQKHLTKGLFAGSVKG